MNTNSLRNLINAVAHIAQDDAYRDAIDNVASAAPMEIVEEPDLLELYAEVYSDTALAIKAEEDNIVNLRSKKYDNATVNDFNRMYKPFNPSQNQLVATN